MPHDVLTRVARRIRFVHGVRAVAWGLGITALAASVLSLAGQTAQVSLGLGLLPGAITLAAAWRAGRPRRGLAAAALAIERVRPASNVIVTAEELRRHPDQARPWIRRLVELRAEQHLAGLDVSSVVPSRSTLVVLAIAGVALSIAVLLVARPRTLEETITRLQEAASAALPGRSVSPVRVTLEPPAYTGRPAVTFENPPRLEALEGSVVRFAGNDGLRIRFGERPVEDRFVAGEGGYFVIEQPGVQGTQLLPLIVTRDSVPTVRVDAPGKDLLLGTGGSAIPLKFSASDDLALGALELRYTKVSGTGENFEFQEGRLPVALDRLSHREWTGRGQLPLPELRLEPGDSLVYRVVARDRRPGDAGEGTSDTYFVEIAGPGQIALEGVEMPPELERYALSQQMIVVKLERLRARETSMARALVLEEAGTIAAEQRAVRANFIFLMGGHVEDEEIEAEQSHEIQEGRLENTARRDINTAIGHMTRVEQGLAAVSTAAALPPARLAVEALQRAFGRSRYLLRALATRSRLDQSRRLSGDLGRARDWHRDSLDGGDDEDNARELFDRLVAAARRLSQQEDVPRDEWSKLAESALRIEPSSPFWQGLSRSLAELRDVERPSALGTLERILHDLAPRAQAQTLPSLGGLRRSPLSRAWQAEAGR